MSIKPVSKTTQADGINRFDRLADTTHVHIFSYLPSAGSEQPAKVCKRWQYSILGYTPLDPSLRKSLLYSTRPKAVQEKIDQVYRSLSEIPHGYPWLYSGSGGFYDYLGFQDRDVITRCILSAPAGKQVLTFLDLGAGKFVWVNATRDFLCSKFKESHHRFQVIGVSGDGLPHDEIEKRGNVTTHKISGFRLENLLDDFPKLKLNLVDSVEFIVCYWTLQHLFDHIGTLEQAFHLLTPGNGFLFGTAGEGEDDNLNLKQLFGMFSYITRYNAVGKLPLFALFREKYGSSDGLQTFAYDPEKPILELSHRFDSYAGSTANVKRKGYVRQWDMPFGGGFYGCGTYVLEKLLGKIQSLWHLKNYLENIPAKGYEVELPEMSLPAYCHLHDL